MSRSSQTLQRPPAAAFDFDVVTDVPLRPVRKPDATLEAPPPAANARRTAETGS